MFLGNLFTVSQIQTLSWTFSVSKRFKFFSEPQFLKMIPCFLFLEFYHANPLHPLWIATYSLFCCDFLSANEFVENSLCFTRAFLCHIPQLLLPQCCVVNNLKIQWFITTNSYFSVIGLLKAMTLVSLPGNNWAWLGLWCGFRSLYFAAIWSCSSLIQMADILVKIHDVSRFCLRNSSLSFHPIFFV